MFLGVAGKEWGEGYLDALVEPTAALKLPTVQLFTAPHSVAQSRSKTPWLSLRLSKCDQRDRLRSLKAVDHSKRKSGEEQNATKMHKVWNTPIDCA